MIQIFQSLNACAMNLARQRAPWDRRRTSCPWPSTDRRCRGRGARTRTGARSASGTWRCRGSRRAGSCGVSVVGARSDAQGSEGDDDGEDTLKDEDPPPALETGRAVHELDETREQAAEGTGHRGHGAATSEIARSMASAQENCHAQVDLALAVPARHLSGQRLRTRSAAALKNVTPGKSPASVMPRKTRVAKRPAKFCAISGRARRGHGPERCP